jgi:DNA-binding LytR/AlgR family response regulator
VSPEGAAATGDTTRSGSLRVLAVDDESPALADLEFQLRSCELVGEVILATDATSALRALRDRTFDVAFLDVRMPGLDGLELARILQQLASRPEVVFVTAHEAHAVEAFEIRAVDYLLKPVRRERIERALATVLERRTTALGAAGPVEAFGPGPVEQDGSTAMSSLDVEAGQRVSSETPNIGAAVDDDAMIAVETGGRIRFIDRRDIRYVSAAGDYVRFHVRDGSLLHRVALSALEERWAQHDFVRVHRSYLVALGHIDEIRIEPGRGYVLVVGDTSIPVSRRLSSNLRRQLVSFASRRRPR